MTESAPLWKTRIAYLQLHLKKISK